MKDHTLPFDDALEAGLNESARRQGMLPDPLLLSIVRTYLTPLMNELAVVREAKRLDTYEKAADTATIAEIKALIEQQDAETPMIEGIVVAKGRKR